MLFCISKESIKSFQNVAKEDTCVLLYDTTFNLDDFYVSPLTYHHSHLHTTENVFLVIPLAYLIHEKKSFTVHKKFFSNLKEFCPEIYGKIFITVREKAINVALKDILPQSTNLFCWRHVQQDVKYWVNEYKEAEDGDVINYVNNIWDLLDSESEDDYPNKYIVSAVWSQKFLDYYNEHIHDIVLKAGKWVVQEVSTYLSFYLK